MKVTEVSKFTCVAYKFISPLVVGALKDSGISEYYAQQARGMVAIENRKLPFFSGNSIMENMLDSFHFISPLQKESDVFDRILKAASLNQEGRGSIYVEPAYLVEGDENSEFNMPEDVVLSSSSSWTGIYCIIQRGRGDRVARAALNTGASVPVIYYGLGGGIRDRMGLIRITIPAEKEMISLVVPEHDSKLIMNLLIESGNLDRPGMGFIFDFPVKRAAMDTKSFIGTNIAAASMGQIVTAIDDIKGGTGWRKKQIDIFSRRDLNYIKNLEDLMIICEDTKAREMLDVAMSVGASGATISQSKRNSFTSEGITIKTPVEISDMVIKSSQKKQVIEAMAKAGLFDKSINGRVIVRKSSNAFTYVEKRQPKTVKNL